MEHRRNNSVDIAKGIAMISIVFGHLGNERINSIVMSYDVPLFFFLAGYFLKKRSIVDFIKYKSKKLLLPYSITAVIVCVLSIPFSFFSGISWYKEVIQWFVAALYGAGFEMIKPVGIRSIGAIWFLLALFWAELLFIIIADLKRGWRFVVVVLMAILCTLTAQWFWLPFSIQAGGFSVIFLYVGYLLKEHEQQLRHFMGEKNELQFMLLFVSCIIWQYSMMHYEGITLSNAKIGKSIDVIVILASVYVVMFLSEKINAYTIGVAKVLAFIGRNSLLFLCVHLIETDLIPWMSVFQALAGRFALPDTGFVAIIVAGKLLIIIGIVLLWDFVSHMKLYKERFRKISYHKKTLKEYLGIFLGWVFMMILVLNCPSIPLWFQRLERFVYIVAVIGITISLLPGYKFGGREKKGNNEADDIICTKKKSLPQWCGCYWWILLLVHLIDIFFLDWMDIYAFIPSYWQEDVIVRLSVKLFMAFCVFIVGKEFMDLNENTVTRIRKADDSRSL
ncbi:MAG: acyltransferase [Lachnospiraceae bacterium]|nr:acyltransferase [Lachnospiraceae bacterium]